MELSPVELRGRPLALPTGGPLVPPARPPPPSDSRSTRRDANQPVQPNKRSLAPHSKPDWAVGRVYGRDKVLQARRRPHSNSNSSSRSSRSQAKLGFVSGATGNGSLLIIGQREQFAAFHWPARKNKSMAFHRWSADGLLGAASKATLYPNHVSHLPARGAVKREAGRPGVAVVL